MYIYGIKKIVMEGLFILCVGLVVLSYVIGAFSEGRHS